MCLQQAGASAARPGHSQRVHCSAHWVRAWPHHLPRAPLQFKSAKRLALPGSFGASFCSPSIHIFCCARAKQLRRNIQTLRRASPAALAGAPVSGGAESTGSTLSDESHALGAPRGGRPAPGDDGAGGAPGNPPHGALEWSQSPLQRSHAGALPPAPAVTRAQQAPLASPFVAACRVATELLGCPEERGAGGAAAAGRDGPWGGASTAMPAHQAAPSTAGVLASPFVAASRAPLPDTPVEQGASAAATAGRGVPAGGSPAASAALRARSAAEGSPAGDAVAGAASAPEAAQDSMQGVAGPGASAWAGAADGTGVPAEALGGAGGVSMVVGSPRGLGGTLQGPGSPSRDLAAALVEQTLRAMPRRPDAVSHIQCGPAASGACSAIKSSVELLYLHSVDCVLWHPW